MDNTEEVKEEKKPKKIATYIVDGVLGLIIVFLLSVMVQMFMTQNKNFGVPRAYGFSFLYVLTDSMEGTITEYEIDSFPSGTGIVVKQVSPTEIKVGDVVTFYEQLTLKDGSKVGIVNTHRIMDHAGHKGVERQEDGLYHFHTVGDNAKSESGSYSSLGENFDERYLIGKVVCTSEGLGKFLAVVSPSASGWNDSQNKTNTSWFFPVLIITPVAGIAIANIISTVREAHRVRVKEDAMLEAALAEAGVDRNDPVAVEKFSAKFFFKLEYREQMEKEKEKAKEEAREIFEKQKKIEKAKAKKAAKYKEEIKAKIKKEMEEQARKEAQLKAESPQESVDQEPSPEAEERSEEHE